MELLFFLLGFPERLELGMSGHAKKNNKALLGVVSGVFCCSLSVVFGIVCCSLQVEYILSLYVQYGISKWRTATE